MQNFLDERCNVGSTLRVSGSELYAEYRRWAAENGEYVRRNRDFAAELETRKFMKQKTMKGATWIGLALQTAGVGDENGESVDI